MNCPEELVVFIATILDKSYEKRYCFGSHKQLKNSLKRPYGEVEDNIIIYIYKHLRLKT